MSRNLSEVLDLTELRQYRATVGLTSDGIQGALHSKMSDAKIKTFIRQNNLTDKEAVKIRLFIAEARKNNFDLLMVNANHLHKQEDILKELKS